MAIGSSSPVVFDPGNRFIDGLGLLNRAILALSELADNQVQPAMVKIGRIARERAEELTPPDRDPRDIEDPPFSPQISESWVTIEDRSLRNVTVTNTHPQGNAPFETGRGSIIEALEYGTKPHTIRARRAKHLYFIDRSGNERFDIKVRHPGNRPYGMLAGATAIAGEGMNILLDRLTKFVEKEWTTPGKGPFADLGLTLSRKGA